MPELNDLQSYLVHEFVAEYKEGHMSRRDMMRRVLYITGGVASTATLLTSLGCTPSTAVPTATTAAAKPTTAPAPSPAAAASSPAASPAAKPAASPSAGPSPSPAASGARSPLSVAANDPAVDGQDITFPGNGTTIMAYQARPKNASGPLPVVLVCHENRGLTDHIRDVARRFAKEGYVACAVDLLSREGGTAKVADPAQLAPLLANVDANRHVGDFKAAVEFYKTQSSARADRIGINGYCFGGGIVWRAVEGIPDLKAAVPYYGPFPPLEQVPQIKAAVFGVYSSDPNDFANNRRDDLEAALKQAGITYQMKVYPDSRHAFNNDTGASYNEPAALAAWRDMLDWFQKYLKA